MPYPVIRYTVHAAEHLIGRGIRRREVEAVLQRGERIEDYPEDPRGASYLMLGWQKARPLHVVAADDDQGKETVVITLYEPDPERWSDAHYTTKKTKQAGLAIFLVQVIPTKVGIQSVQADSLDPRLRGDDFL